MHHENWKREQTKKILESGDWITECTDAEGVISAGLKNLKNEEKFKKGVERSFFIYLTIHTFTLVFFLMYINGEYIAEKLEL